MAATEIAVAAIARRMMKREKLRWELKAMRWAMKRENDNTVLIIHQK
jgi:hypothetical protein